VSAFGKEALGNPKTAESMAKGMQSLGSAVGNGLGDSMDSMKDLILSMDVTAPALGLLTATFQSQTMQSQTELMIALMEFSQSEGVKLTSDALAALVNGVKNGITNFVTFSTNLSTIVGKVITSSPYFKRVKDAFDALSLQSATTLKTALSSLLSVIQTLADNPLVIASVDKMFLKLEESLKKTTIALNLIDYILKQIEAKLEKFLPWLFPPETQLSEQGFVLVPGPNASTDPNATEEDLINNMSFNEVTAEIWLRILALLQSREADRQQAMPISDPNRGYVP
jgi:hypothetical protein